MANAISNFTSAIAAEPKESDYYYARAIAYYQQKNFESALVDYNKAIELNPKNGVAFYGRAVVNKIMNRKQDAINDFTTYIQLNNNNDGLEREVYRLIAETKEEEE